MLLAVQNVFYFIFQLSSMGRVYIFHTKRLRLRDTSHQMQMDFAGYSMLKFSRVNTQKDIVRIKSHPPSMILRIHLYLMILLLIILRILLFLWLIMIAKHTRNMWSHLSKITTIHSGTEFHIVSLLGHISVSVIMS